MKINFNSDEVQEVIEAYFKDMEDRDKKALEIVKNRGEDILNRILHIIERDGALIDESLLYRPEEFDVTEEEYHALFNTMMGYAGEEREFQDLDNPFEHKLFCYAFDEDDYVELRIMWGQGCITSFSELSDIKFNSSNITKIVSFDAFMKHIRSE